MGLIVQKYGGTSVANLERIQKVAERVAKTFDQGHQVVVILSAMTMFFIIVSIRKFKIRLE